MAASTTPLRWDDGTPDPLAPPTGIGFAWTGRAAHDYRRLTCTVDLTGHTSATLAFRASYSLTRGWDHLFVEARTPDGDDWTTLPVPGRTSSATGAACAADLTLATAPAHPEPAAYQGPNCAPAGRTGEWHAATGRSAGWEDWTVDLSRYAGRSVEISITTATDALAPRLGAFVDDVAVSTDGRTPERTSFEPVEVPAPPPTPSDGWGTGWARTGRVFASGAALLTADTAYLGFGLEALPADGTRAALLRAALNRLLAAGAPAETAFAPPVPPAGAGVLSCSESTSSRGAALMTGQKRVAIVTGGTRGIGAAITTALARDGVHVAAGYHRGTDAAEELQEALVKEGLSVSIHVGNVGDPADCLRVVAEVLDAHGRVDHLVNNAGVTVDKTVRRMTVEDWHAVLRVNLSGAFYMTKAVLEQMIAQEFGRIVNISSVIGSSGNIGQANYAASKSGLFGLTRSLARETARKGITVNCVTPGFIATEMVAKVPPDALAAVVKTIPVGRLGEAEEIARAVTFLLDDAAGYITGSVLAVNGGLDMS